MKKWMILIIFLFIFSCKYFYTESQRIEKTLNTLSAEEAMEKGRQAMEEGKYKIAKIYFKFVVDNFSSSPFAVEALINVASAAYLAGGWEELLEAKQRFSDFYSRYPQNENAEYALFMQGKIALKLKEKPDRDQVNVLAALSFFNRYQQLYPQGKYIEEVKEGIKECRKNLALHELAIANFYFKRKAYRGALGRLDNLIKTYPDFEEMEKVYLLYAKIYEKTQDLEKKEYYLKKYEETLDRKEKKL
ncbi:MAG: outer membrane protein assembly factor BamD [Thermoanaerobaculia bacterium]